MFCVTITPLSSCSYLYGIFNRTHRQASFCDTQFGRARATEERLKPLMKSASIRLSCWSMQSVKSGMRVFTAHYRS